jgi:transcriptional regulator with XRE-family HTH domain
MSDHEDPWRSGVEELGRFIHSQRKLAKLSLRELAGLTDLSNAYLSQLERGMHEPSIRVIDSIARAFDLSAEALLTQAGLLHEHRADTAEPVAPTEASIRSDPSLTEVQKEALLAVYRGFTIPSTQTDAADSAASAG